MSSALYGNNQNVVVTLNSLDHRDGVAQDRVNYIQQLQLQLQLQLTLLKQVHGLMSSR